VSDDVRREEDGAGRRQRTIPHAHPHELRRVGGADEGDAQGEAPVGGGDRGHR